MLLKVLRHSFEFQGYMFVISTKLGAGRTHNLRQVRICIVFSASCKVYHLVRNMLLQDFERKGLETSILPCSEIQVIFAKSEHR